MVINEQPILKYYRKLEDAFVERIADDDLPDEGFRGQLQRLWATVKEHSGELLAHAAKIAANLALGQANNTETGKLATGVTRAIGFMYNNGINGDIEPQTAAEGGVSGDDPENPYLAEANEFRTQMDMLNLDVVDLNTETGELSKSVT